MPLKKKSISLMGLFFIIIGIFIFLPLAILGLFLKEEYYVCPHCGARVRPGSL